jgi:NADPH2:quinone reductase
MKAVRIHERGDVNVLQVEEVPMPAPQQGEVLIKVAAAGMNYGDVGQRTGNYPNTLPLPLTLGYEVAGTIASRGHGVNLPAEGTRVVSLVDGGYAEYAIARAENVVPLPDNVSFAQATIVPVQGQTAYLALTRGAHFSQGESVLVHTAAGGVGSLAMQIAKILGAGTVIGTTTSESKLSLIRELGADAAINSKADNWIEQVMQATRGQGVDIILDPIGGTVSQQGIACLSPFGRLINYGSLTGAPTPFVSQMLIAKCLSVIGYNTIVQPLEEQLHASQALLDFISEGRLRVVLNHTFPLNEARAAQQAIESGQTTGKVVLMVN